MRPARGTQRRRRLVWLVAVCAGLVAAAARADLSGMATLTSQYVYRGRAASGFDPALQLGLDYQHHSGWFAGAWASTIALPGIGGSTRRVELDYYAGYLFRGEGPLALTLSILRYTYPGQDDAWNYDYNEYLGGFTLHERASLEFGYTEDAYGFDRRRRHWEFRYDQPVANAWVFGAGVGHNAYSGPGGDGFLHWDIGASARFSRLTVDLRWYDNQTPGTFVSALSADSQFVVSLTTAF